MEATSQGTTRLRVGRPKPSHSSSTSISWKIPRRASSTVIEETSRIAVLIHKMNGNRKPGVDPSVVRVEVTSVLGHEKGTDDRDKEHQVAAKREKYAEAVLLQSFAWPTTTLRPIVPVVVVSTTTRVLFIHRRASATAGVAFTVATRRTLFNIAGMENCWQSSEPTAILLRNRARCPLRKELVLSGNRRVVVAWIAMANLILAR